MRVTEVTTSRGAGARAGPRPILFAVENTDTEANRLPLDRGPLSPLSIAAYATVLLIMSDQWLELDDDARNGWLGLAASAALLVGFVVREITDRDARATVLRAAMLVLQGVAALVAIWFSGSNAAPVLLVIFAAQLAGTLSIPATIAVLLVTNAVVYWTFASGSWSSRPLFATLLYAGFQAFAVMTMRLAVAAERARDELAAANAELVATRSLLDESARAGERLRMSRELHDVAGHGLTALKLNLELADRTAEPERGRRIKVAIDLAEQLLADLRGVVSQLRRHDGIDVGVAIAALAHRMPSIAVELDLDPVLRLATVEQGEAVLRCVQEALTNAARHAQAKRVVIRARRENDRVLLTVADDGRGSAALTPGNGIAGMRERLAAIGGEVEFTTAPGRGFVVAASVPVT